MFTISFDSSTVESRIERLTETINNFGAVEMPHELTEWQTKDMHRKYPNQDQPDPKTTQTSIWPRSRLSNVSMFHRTRPSTGRPRGRPKGVKTGQGRKIIRKKRVKGQAPRPILRPELFVKLCDRMAILMQSKIKWR